MHSTTTTRPALTREAATNLIIRARRRARTAPNRRQILAAIAELEARLKPGPIETAILNGDFTAATA